MNSTTNTFITWLVRRRMLLLALGVLLAVVGAIVGRKLDMNRSIARMFRADDPILAPYENLQHWFGEHEIVLAIYSDAALPTAEGLARLATVAASLREIPGVAAAVSLADPPGAADFTDTQRGARLREVFVGYTHNAALDAVGVVCLIQRENASEVTRSETLQRMRAVVEQNENGTLVGEPVLVEEAFNLLEVDGRRLNSWCTVLLAGTIFLCFRRLRWIALPLVVVQITLAATRGSLVLAGLELSMVSSMLAAIVTVVAVATVMHVVVRIESAVAAGMSPTDAAIFAGRVLAAPIFFACLTDAAGFAALMISDVGPVRDFGLMMAVGSLLVLVGVATATPAIVLMRQTISPQPEADARNSDLWLRRLLSWALAHSRTVAIGGIAACSALAWGATRLELETDFTRNFRPGSRLVVGYEFVEANFGGAGVWDISIAAPGELDKRFLLRVLALEQRLLDEVPQLTKAISLADIVDAGANGIDDLGPLLARGAIRAGLALARGNMFEFTAAIYHGAPGIPPAERRLRIMLRASERMPAAEKVRVIEQVELIARDEFPSAEVTGYFVLLARLVESLIRDQWLTFSVAAAAILVVMSFAFRSVALALVAMVPNALPVLAVFGGMGWLGVKVNMGAAMIAAVSLGLSVDGSIHYIMAYQRRRREGASAGDALDEVQGNVGRAAVIATLALVVGFSTLLLSEFVPTIYFGALVSLAMVGGLIGNLVLLPVLLQLVDPTIAVSDGTAMEN